MHRNHPAHNLHQPQIRPVTSGGGGAPHRGRNHPAVVRRRGFTLIELIVASIIATIVATAATFSLERLVKSRDRSTVRQAAQQSVYTVATTIANDVRNLVRDPYLLNSMFRITSSASSSSGVGASDKSDQYDELLMFCRDDRPVRPDGEADPSYKEGGVYEVQYRLKPDSEVGGVLWQRRDPGLDDNYQGGGVAIPLAINITSLSIQAFDGTSWRTTWDSDNDGYPHEVRITCKGEIPESHLIVYASTSVALDRTPNLFDPTHDEDYDPSSDIQNLDLGNDSGNPDSIFKPIGGGESSGTNRGGRRSRGGGSGGGGGGFNRGGRGGGTSGGSRSGGRTRGGSVGGGGGITGGAGGRK